MDEIKTYRVVAVIALFLGVIGITIGYAAFSNTLSIMSSAEVHPSADNFNVDFSSSNSSVVANPITPTLSETVTGFTATNATIDNTSDPQISNLHATFTEPGQTVTYEFYTYNAGLYIAYLNSINFTGSKTCTAATGTTQALVDDACAGITLEVEVGSESATNATVASISGHSLAVGAAEQVTVTIAYEAGSDIADGDFTVALPTITLVYGSAD